jgi:hypothetical protein
MADQARIPERRITAGTAIGMDALKPVVEFQVSLLRMWAITLERFAGNYERGLKETVQVITTDGRRA